MSLAEHRHGAGRDARCLLVVATGHRGVGGALVLNGTLCTGSSGLGMEAGHVSVDLKGRAWQPVLHDPGLLTARPCWRGPGCRPRQFRSVASPP